MKKLLLLVLLLIPTAVSAHTLATDGSIGAVMHVDPSDDPTANETSTFYFDFQDRNGQFALPECLCSVIVKQNGTELTSVALTAASFPYVFPSKGAYDVEVIGVPQAPNAFQPFTLNYTVRVDHDVNDAKTPFPIWGWAIIVVAGAALLIAGAALAPRRPAAKP